jgi:putative endonuclease
MLTNRSGTLYVGLTNDLVRRMWEHRNRAVQGFSARYGVDRLVYFEPFDWVEEAIAREKQIKRWRREKKVALIESMNPTWRDLYPSIVDDGGL